jgi:putative membrane protein
MKLDVYRKYFLLFLLLQYFFGSIGFVFYPDFFRPFTPLTILFTCFVYLLYQPYSDRRFMQSLAVIAVVGFVAEVLGVHTGAIFGRYYYGNALGLKLWEVPLVISANWALIVSASIILCAQFIRHSILHAAVAALLATSIDFVIEQVVSPLDFWYFEGNIAGWHNYLGWFVVSFFLGLATRKYLVSGNSRIALYILLLQVYFFSVICALI